MGVTLLQIRDGVQARLADLADTHVVGLPTGSAPLPLAVVWPPSTGTYYGTYGDEGYYGDDEWTITIYTARTLAQLSVDLLLDYMAPTGPRSVYRAFNVEALDAAGHQSLGGLVDDAKILGWRIVHPEDTEAVTVWGVSFVLRVVARRPAQ